MKAHITNLGLENFRVFKDKTHFEFAPITILTGTNSSGKSSLINALNFLRQNVKHSINDIMLHDFDVYGLSRTMGGMRNLITKGSAYEEFKVFFTELLPTTDDECIIEITLGIQDNIIGNGAIKNIIVRSSNSNKIIFELNAKRDFSSSENHTSKVHFTAKVNFPFFEEALKRRVNKNNEYITAYNYLIKECDLANNKIANIEELQQKIRETNEKFKSVIELIISDDEYHLFDNNYELGFPQWIIKRTKQNGEKKNFDSWKKKGISNILGSFINVENKHRVIELLKQKYGSSGYVKLFNSEFIEYSSKIPFFNFHYHELTEGPISDLSFLGEINSLNHVFIQYYWATKQTNESELWKHFIKAYYAADPSFYKDVFEPLCELFFETIPYFRYSNPSIDFIMGDSLEPHEQKRLMEHPYSGYEPNDAELEMFEIIKKLIAKIEEKFYELKIIGGVPNNRIEVKRSYEINAADYFSTLLNQISRFPREKSKLAFDFINKFVDRFALGDRLLIESDDNTGSFKISISKSGKEMLVADLGFGISQVLPIILACIPNPGLSEFINPGEHYYGSKCICIEEPEANLHPALQSQLADMFVEAAAKFNTQFIIETHSEYLIRKLQYLTAKGEIMPKDTVIYYFYPPEDPKVLSEEVEQVVKINIRKDGMLTEDFGDGFFDESARWTFELLKLNSLN